MGVDAGFTQPCTPAARRGRGELLSTAFSPPSARTQALSSAPRAPRRRAPRRSGLLLRTKRANPWHFVPKIVEGRSAAAARNVHGEVREALLPCRSHRFPHYSWSSSAWVYVQSENHPQRGTFFAPGPTRRLQGRRYRGALQETPSIIRVPQEHYSCWHTALVGDDVTRTAPPDVVP